MKCKYCWVWLLITIDVDDFCWWWVCWWWVCWWWWILMSDDGDDDGTPWWKMKHPLKIFIVIVIFLVIIPMYCWFGGNTYLNLESPQSVQTSTFNFGGQNELLICWLGYVQKELHPKTTINPETSLKSGCELEDLPIGKPSRLGSKAQRGGAEETNDW